VSISSCTAAAVMPEHYRPGKRPLLHSRPVTHKVYRSCCTDWVDKHAADLASLLHDVSDCVILTSGDSPRCTQGTLAAARAVFASPAAVAAFADGGALAGRGSRWEVSDITVDASGALFGQPEKVFALFAWSHDFKGRRMQVACHSGTK